MVRASGRKQASHLREFLDSLNSGRGKELPATVGTNSPKNFSACYLLASDLLYTSTLSYSF